MKLNNIELVVIDQANDTTSLKAAITNICQSYLQQHSEGNSSTKKLKIFDTTVLSLKAKHTHQEKAESLLKEVEGIEDDNQLLIFLRAHQRKIAGGYYGGGHFAYYIERAMNALGNNNQAFSQDIDDIIRDGIISPGF